MPYIFSIAAYYYHSYEMLVKIVKIVSKIKQQRFIGIKHEKYFLDTVIKFILKKNNLKINDIEVIFLYGKSYLKLKRIIQEKFTTD